LLVGKIGLCETSAGESKLNLARPDSRGGRPLHGQWWLTAKS